MATKFFESLAGKNNQGFNDMQDKLKQAETENMNLRIRIYHLEEIKGTV